MANTNDDINFKYQASLCNEAIYNTMFRFKAAGLPDAQIKLMMECVGKALVRCSLDDHSVEYFMEHYKETLTHPLP